jgi:hypothetical protein
MSVRRKIFWSTVTAFFAVDLLAHFVGEYQTVRHVVNPRSAAYLVLFLAWNTLADSLGFLTSDLGIIALLAFAFLYVANMKRRGPPPAPPTDEPPTPGC